jgi:DNA replication and repair protein RecF
MQLDHVQITQFRNIATAHLKPSPSLNVIVGENGSGKSSLLEAIHYLGYGRSFRTNKHRSVIQSDTKQFSVFAACSDRAGSIHKLGILRNQKDEFLCAINGEKSQRLADLVAYLPIQIFTPQSSDVLLGAPNQRRRYIDWGLFHVEQSFYVISLHYIKILKQRNALLKKALRERGADMSQLGYWNAQLASYGEKIHTARASYINAIKNDFARISQQFLPEFSVEISYNAGWDQSQELLSALEQKLAYDSKVGYTSVGIHKADLKVLVNGVNAVERLSRGQLRMLVAALQLAQTLYLNHHSQKTGVFLLDDIGAELDLSKRELFIDELLSTQTQLFVTAIEQDQLSFIQKYNDKKMFHVEHGQVKEEL